MALYQLVNCMNIKIITTLIFLFFSVGALASYESDLVEAYSKLKLGMSKETAQKIMGEPNQSRKNITKKGEFVGYSYTYVIYKYKEGLVNLEHDRLIQLFFNVNAKLKWAVPQNIKGLKEIGTPAR